jgi:hypothetical protein
MIRLRFDENLRRAIFFSACLEKFVADCPLPRHSPGYDDEREKAVCACAFTRNDTG